MARPIPALMIDNPSNEYLRTILSDTKVIAYVGDVLKHRTVHPTSWRDYPSNHCKKTCDPRELLGLVAGKIVAWRSLKRADLSELIGARVENEAEKFTPPRILPYPPFLIANWNISMQHLASRLDANRRADPTSSD